MSRRGRRHLEFDDDPKRPGGPRSKIALKHPDMTWHDHVVMLLHIGAEIEHGLMVQYLYAAYSLGGDHVPLEHRPIIQRWRESILAIAKEEMGHLLTVQNVLTVLGASINLDREDFPWDIEYYPFPFRLEPLTMDSLACYVYAEMPPESEFDKARARAPGRKLEARYERFETQEKARIIERVSSRVRRGKPHMVGVIYQEIIDILEHELWILDSDFQEHTFETQASWDDWGRSYRGDPRLLDAEGNRVKLPPGTKPTASEFEAQVLIDRVATRTQALAALRALSAQGEAPHLGQDDLGEPSHFDRFLEIYQDLENLGDAGWLPSLPVAVDPTTRTVAGAKGKDKDRQKREEKDHYIQAPRSRDWADLFNLRYRMLLTYLSHTFRLARTTRSDVPSVRAAVMHKVFGEMYNLKTIAGILMRLPLRDDGSATRAGPPFEMPYSLSLPPAEADTWRLHWNLLRNAEERCVAMLDSDETVGRDYLANLLALDRQTSAWVDQLLAGCGATERQPR